MLRVTYRNEAQSLEGRGGSRTTDRRCSRLPALAAAVFLVFSPAAWGEPAESAVGRSPAGAPYAAGELIVTYEERAPDNAVESLDEEVGAEVEEKLPEIDARLLEFPEVQGESPRKRPGSAISSR